MNFLCVDCDSRREFRWHIAAAWHFVFSFGHKVVLEKRCRHRWDGPVISLQEGESVTCSECGMLAIDDKVMGDGENGLRVLR